MTYINYINMSINVKNLTFSYHGERLVENLNFNISNRSVGLIKGESGSGKSTLLNVIAGLKKADTGDVVCNNKIFMNKDTFLPPERRKIGYVFQDFALFPHISAEKNITYALNKRFLQKDYTTHELNLNDHLLKMPHELSGGQQQRVAIARALVNQPSILFADEPTGNLDSKTGDDVMNIFKQLNSNGQTIILITHEHSISNQSNRIITIMDGLIKSDIRE